MAYTEFPLLEEFGKSRYYGYQLTNQSDPSSVSLKPDTNDFLYISQVTLAWTGATTWGSQPTLTTVTNSGFGLYINGPDETEKMHWASPPAVREGQYGFASTLNLQQVLRPQWGLVFNCDSFVDSGGSTMAIYFKMKAVVLDINQGMPILPTPIS